MANEATAVNETVEQATTTTESAAEETKELEVIREGEELDPNDFTESETEGEEESEETAETKEETKAEETEDEKPLGEKGQRRLQQLANDNKALKDRIKELETVQPKTEQYDVRKAIEEKGLTPEQARIEALEQDRRNDKKIQEANEESQRIYELNTSLTSDADNVVRDFPELDENSPQYDKEITESVMNLWHVAADVQYATDEKGEVVLDRNGNPIVTQARVPLYDFVENINAIGAAKQKRGEVEGQKAAEKNLSAVEPRPVAKAPKSNPDDSKLSADAYAKKHGLKVSR